MSIWNTSTYNTTNTLANNGSLNYSYNITNSTAPYSFINNVNNPVFTIPAGSSNMILEESAALEVKGRVIINGENLEERLQRIETLLNIPTRDIALENKYPKLKKLWSEYMSELEKYKTWERIKE